MILQDVNDPEQIYLDFMSLLGSQFTITSDIDELLLQLSSKLAEHANDAESD